MKNVQFLVVLFLYAYSFKGFSQIQKTTFSNERGEQLKIEVWSDDLIHFQFLSSKSSIYPSPSISISEMVYKTDYEGAKKFKQKEQKIETASLIFQVNPITLEVTFTDKTLDDKLTSFTPFYNLENKKGIKASCTPDLRVLGLGQHFKNIDTPSPNLNGKIREGGKYGNKMIYLDDDGANGDTQIPIMYALNGNTFKNYAVFLDNVYKHSWDFTNENEWNVTVDNGELNFFFISGKNLPALREKFIQLTGLPPIPPKKMFGLWVSEYGYDSWQEMESKLKTLRENQFPIDGFVLDLQWFGGIGENHRMGSLAWDTKAFPNPKEKISELRDNEGIGLMPIEEAYSDKNNSAYLEYKKAGVLVTSSNDTNQTDILDTWWGQGGMIDYSSEKAGAYIHKNKRKAFLDDGIIGHWLDLGEPENFNKDARYAKGTHADIHNMWNFYWLKSLYEGYKNEGRKQRLFAMTRAGSAGLQRMGAAMWSGDIAARMRSFAKHVVVQSNMSLSGIDYFGSDIGGFHREAQGKELINTKKEIDDLYTQWYAYASLFDVPVRPHAANVFPEFKIETAPDRVGDLSSNLANTRLRYTLIPYMYSLAWKANQNGTPVFPPLIYYYQHDKNVFNKGDHKLIGKNLLGVASIKKQAKTKKVYLPKGTWYNWYDHKKIVSSGETINASLYNNKLFQLPLYAKEGAIIPLASIDKNSMNALGKRMDGKVDNDLNLRIYLSKEKSNFTLYEDDGQTIEYIDGKYSLTEISQKSTNKNAIINIQTTKNNYFLDHSRNNIVEIVTDKNISKIKSNGVLLKELISMDDFKKQSKGYIKLKSSILLKTGSVKAGENNTIINLYF